jgi:hypothetical protein
MTSLKSVIKPVSIVLFLILKNLVSFSQEISKEITLDYSIDGINIDRYGHIYEMSYDNLFKKNKHNEILYSYSNKNLGKISQVDVSNPLRPLLLYKDMGVICVLDNTLSQQEKNIDLNSLSLYQTNCIANSNFDNGIWLFDVDINELIKIDIHSNITYRSGNLAVILPDFEGPIIRMQEYNKHLFAFTNNQIFEFDQFGSLLHIISASASKGFIYDDDGYILYDGAHFLKYIKLDFKLDTLMGNSSYTKVVGELNEIVGFSKDLNKIQFLQFDF